MRRRLAIRPRRLLPRHQLPAGIAQALGAGSQAPLGVPDEVKAPLQRHFRDGDRGELARREFPAHRAARRSPTYKARSLRPTKLDPDKGYLTERVRQARPMWLPATVLLREIRERGYPRRMRRCLSPPKVSFIGRQLANVACRNRPWN